MKPVSLMFYAEYEWVVEKFQRRYWQDNHGIFTYYLASLTKT